MTIKNYPVLCYLFLRFYSNVVSNLFYFEYNSVIDDFHFTFSKSFAHKKKQKTFKAKEENTLQPLRERWGGMQMHHKLSYLQLSFSWFSLHFDCQKYLTDFQSSDKASSDSSAYFLMFLYREMRAWNCLLCCFVIWSIIF